MDVIDYQIFGDDIQFVASSVLGRAYFRNVGDTKARITATVDSDGNRTSVTTDAT